MRVSKECFGAPVVIGSGIAIFLRRWRRVVRLAVVLDVRGEGGEWLI
jgi:hypothetical protein